MILFSVNFKARIGNNCICNTSLVYLQTFEHKVPFTSDWAWGKRYLDTLGHDFTCLFDSNRKYKITECWQDMDAFVQLDDSIIDILWAKIQGNVKDELYKLLEQFQSRKINYKHIMTFTERHIKIFEVNFKVWT